MPMGGEFLRDPREEAVERRDAAKARERLAMNRRIFHELLKVEMAERPLTGRKRRELTQFAQVLGIDPLEVRILIRAVEYTCGHAPRAAMDDIQTPADMRYLLAPGPLALHEVLSIAFLVAFLLAVLTLGMR